MVLRVEKKLFVTELPIPLADSKYLRSEMRFMMLIMRNYNMQNMGKTIGELHALLIEYEKGLPKKAATPLVMTIQGGRIQKANKKSLNAKGKDKGKGNQLEKTIKALRSDRGGEYISQEFKNYLKAYGIVQQHTPPYTPQHSRDYALEIATRILNMVLTKKVDKTPYELWYEKVPNLSYLKVWGCEALVKRDMPNKLQQRSIKCIFIRYPKETMGYYIYFLPENKIVVAMYAKFLEKNLLSQEVSGRAEELDEVQDKDTSPSENTSEIPIDVKSFIPPQEKVVPVRRSVRTHRAPDHLCLNVEVEEYSLGDLNEPANYKVEILDSESDKWVDAMNAEIQSMKDN
nr:hypothetical protein [Tanacetum cinerariifolium]